MSSNRHALRARVRPAVAVSVATAILLAGAAAHAATVGLAVKTAKVEPRSDAVCDDTTIPCSSSADCSNGRACIGTGQDSWRVTGEIDPGADSEAFLREIDRDGVDVTIAAASGAWAGTEAVFEGGECAPAGGDDASVAVEGVRCATGGNSESLLIKPRRRADGTTYLRTTLRMRRQSLDRPAPTAAETPLTVGIVVTTFTATDDVSPCKDRSRGGVTCREP